MDKMDKKMTNIKNQEKKIGLEPNDDLLESKDSDSDCIIIENPQSNQMDCSNINIPFDDMSDITESCQRQLYLMSTEKDELQAETHFNNLMQSNWTPTLSDISCIFSNWGITAETTKTLNLKKKKHVKKHNLERFMNYVHHKILENNEIITTNDVIVISKFAVNVVCNYGAHSHIEAESLFKACIERAFNTEDENSIKQYGDEFIRSNKEDVILEMLFELFMPLYGPATRKLYTYLNYKMYMSLLGKTNEGNPFPSNISDWYIQNLVNKDYFNQHPNKAKVLNKVIRLLKQVDFALNIHEDKEQFSTMTDFFMSFYHTGLSAPYALYLWKLMLIDIN